jgi:hypothetical protein
MKRQRERWWQDALLDKVGRLEYFILVKLSREGMHSLLGLEHARQHASIGVYGMNILGSTNRHREPVDESWRACRL